MFVFELGRHTDVLIDNGFEYLLLMDGRELPHTDRHREIMNDWNFDGRCTVGFGLVKFLVLNFCCTECTH